MEKPEKTKEVWTCVYMPKLEIPSIVALSPDRWLQVALGGRKFPPAHGVNLCQGINLKGCLYFIGKGNLTFSLSK